MFFADPVAAFLNIRRGLKPGGRLAFAFWRSLEENPTYTLPMQAAAAYLPPVPPKVAPDAPGPFAFANPARVPTILAADRKSGLTGTRRQVRVVRGGLSTSKKKK